MYEGIRRPEIITHIFDRPSNRRVISDSEDVSINSEKDQKVIEQYFQDLYGVFMKRFSHFVVESELRPDDTVKLQAMLQEMVKIKRLLAHKNTIEPEID